VPCRGTRPAPPQGSPDLPLAFQMLNDNLQIYRDVGGGSLHRWTGPPTGGEGVQDRPARLSNRSQ